MLLSSRSIKRLLKYLMFTLSMLFVCCVWWTIEYIPNDEQIDDTLKKLRSQLNENKNENLKDIFCIILTKPFNFNRNAKIVNKTWAYDCDKYFFIAKLNDHHEISLPILEPSNYTREDYSKLTDKVYGAFKDIFKKYPDYKWYLKADDDTIIFMDHLRDFLRNKNPLDPFTYGCNFKQKVYKGYQSGGAGYVLSNEAFTRIGKALNENNEFCSNTGIEDQDVARCMRKLDVFMDKSVDYELRERFHPFSVEFHFNGHYLPTYFTFTEYPVEKGVKSSSETSISFHYLTPYQIYKLYTMWLEYKLDIKHDKFELFTSMLEKFLSS